MINLYIIYLFHVIAACETKKRIKNYMNMIGRERLTDCYISQPRRNFHCLFLWSPCKLAWKRFIRNIFVTFEKTSEKLPLYNYLPISMRATMIPSDPNIENNIISLILSWVQDFWNEIYYFYESFFVFDKLICKKILHGKRYDTSYYL